MKYGELKRSLALGTEPVYILSGSDDFLRNYAVGLIKERCLSLPELNFTSAEGAEMNGDRAQEIFNSLRSCPFMSEKRVVLIKEYYPSLDEMKRGDIGDYLADPTESSVLIINNKKSTKIFDKTGAVNVVCESEMPLCLSWIFNMAEKAGVEISREAATMIAEYCLLDFAKINTETGKLIDFCKDDGKISTKAVADLVHKDSDFRIYEMADRIASADYDNAYGIITDLLAKNENEQKLFVALYSHFRRLLFIAVSDASDAELAARLGIKEYAVKMSRKQVGRFSVKKLKRICEKLSEYDVAFKSGDIDVGDVLWNGVFSVMIGA